MNSYYFSNKTAHIYRYISQGSYRIAIDRNRWRDYLSFPLNQKTSIFRIIVNSTSRYSFPRLEADPRNALRRSWHRFWGVTFLTRLLVRRFEAHDSTDCGAFAAFYLLPTTVQDRRTLLPFSACALVRLTSVS